jgi:thiol:disulfide interchange protein DsbG
MIKKINKLKKITFLSAAAMLALGNVGFAASNTTTTSVAKSNPTIDLIQKLTNNQANIDQQFKAVDGYTGYVISPKGNSGQKQILYSDSNGNLVIGTIITKDGQNLSETYNQKYVVAPTAQSAFLDAAKNTTYITEGSDKATHKMYIIFDPNCAYCHLLYKDISQTTLVKDNKLQIRWIPVGFIKQDSSAKSAAILAAKDQDKALSSDELNFDMKLESGGAKPLDNNAQNKKFFDMVEKNNQFATSHGFNATPILIYKTTDGDYSYTPGYVNSAQFASMLNNVSNSWK